MTRTTALAVGCAAAIAAVTAPSRAAQAAPGIDADVLDIPAIAQLRRVGVAIVGAQLPESVAARDLAARSLVKAGHPVVVLQTFASPASPGWLVASCSEHGLDAVALVRISTDTVGWRVNVDVRDPDGDLIVLRRGSSGPYHPTTPGGSPEPVVATFAFAMSPAD